MTAQTVSGAEFERFDLADPAVTESSGLTASIINPGVFWTVNDSGDDPILYAVGERGEALGRWSVPGVVHHDWEDIAAIQTPDGGSLLVIADTGDNTAARDNAALIFVPEPAISAAVQFDPAALTASTATTAAAIRVPVVFPDGPRDVEALLAHPFSGELLLVEKTSGPSAAVYRVPVPVVADASVLLEQSGALGLTGIGPLRQITGGAVAPDGSRFLLLTYGGVREWPLPPGQTMAETLPLPATDGPGPGLGVWEGAGYAADSASVWFSAEGTPSLLVHTSVLTDLP